MELRGDSHVGRLALADAPDDRGVAIPTSTNAPAAKVRLRRRVWPGCSSPAKHRPKHAFCRQMLVVSMVEGAQHMANGLARAADVSDAAPDKEAPRAPPPTQLGHCAARRCNLALDA